VTIVCRRRRLAREQWNRLPGTVVGPSMDPEVGAPAPEPQSPEQTIPGGRGPKQGAQTVRFGANRPEPG